MKRTQTRLLSLLLCLLLALCALCAVSCQTDEKEVPAEKGTGTDTVTDAATDAGTDAGTDTETSADGVKKLGVGATVFHFTVVDLNGNTKQFEISTDETTVGAALSALGLIAGENSVYGLYVKTVDGVTADYNVDQTWWEFLVNGESSSLGVDSVNVEAGAVYTFRIVQG